MTVQYVYDMAEKLATFLVADQEAARKAAPPEMREIHEALVAFGRALGSRLKGTNWDGAHIAVHWVPNGRLMFHVGEEILVFRYIEGVVFTYSEGEAMGVGLTAPGKTLVGAAMDRVYEKFSQTLRATESV